MRTHGTLVKWNDERGFGFIALAQGGDEMFVHISAFPRDGTRPTVGELISFEVEAGDSGKNRATHVMRPGKRTTSDRTDRMPSAKSGGSPFGAAFGLLVIVALGAYGYATLTSDRSISIIGDSAQMVVTTPAPTARWKEAPRTAPRQTFECDGRTYCSEMKSCDEATYFLQNCPNTKMDGDGDGEPCEQQLCD